MLPRNFSGRCFRRNQTVLREENNLPNAVNGRRNRRSVSWFITSRFPNEFSVLFVEREKRLSIAPRIYKNQFTIEDWRAGVIPFDNCAAVFFNEIMTPNSFA